MSALRILCVHAKPRQLAALRGMLEEGGYDVLPVSDGIKALDVLSKENVDGVVMDCHMEGPGGITLRHRISHQLPEMPILLVDEVLDIIRVPLRMFGAYLHDPAPPHAVFAELKG
jgi:CheY-like chemotaxis protein